MIIDTKKNIFIETYGCQMNSYDTELVKSILTKENYSFVIDEDEADIIMLNTCAIRENAHQKAYGRIHDIRHKERKGKSEPVKIGILGCMATNLRTELFENKKLNIDFIAGPDSYKKLPRLIEECFAGDMNVRAGSEPAPTNRPFDLTLSEYETYSDVFPKQEGVNAWIAISRGCNNFCTFCVVPYTRGRERSRAPENVLEEVKLLADQGFQQVTLLGQNVNSYHYDLSVIARSETTKQSHKIAALPSVVRNDTDFDFADLLEAISKVEGIKRIRFTSPHPKDFPDSLIHVVANNPKVCKNIHLPLQAGNNRVLDLMNRTYTQEEFLALAAKVRKINPEIALTTDVIVGFPTETDAEFEDTLKVIKEVEFDSAFMFKYSERQGTVASKKYPDDVPEAIKTERIMILNDIQKDITLKKNSAQIGKELEILIELPTSKKVTDYWPGRTDDNKLVILPLGDYKENQFVKVKILSATPHALKGEIVGS